MGSAQSNEPDAGAPNGNDPGSGGASNAQGAGDAPKKRRTRGPNKPKPGNFVVATFASMKHEEIIKLLTAHAAAQLGTEVAARMTLQVNIDGEWRSLGDALPQGATLQFATAAKAEG